MPQALGSTAQHVLAGGGKTGFRAATNPAHDVLAAAVWAEGRCPVSLNATNATGAAPLGGCVSWSVITSRACAFVLQHWSNGSLSASASVPGASGGILRLIVDDSACVDGEGKHSATESNADLRGATLPTRSVDGTARNHATSTIDGHRSVGNGHCTREHDGRLTLSFELPSGDYSGRSVNVLCD